jgi:predicted ester cyclase
MIVSTVVDGKIKELWGMDDDLAMMTQLGMELRPKQAK